MAFKVVSRIATGQCVVGSHYALSICISGWQSERDGLKQVLGLHTSLRDELDEKLELMVSLLAVLHDRCVSN